MRHRLIFLFDIAAVFVSPFAALLLRDGSRIAPGAFANLLPLALTATLFAVMIFAAAGTHRTLWRYFSLHDLLRTIGAATLAVLVPLPICFAVDRLDGVARSLPLLQWLFLVAILTALRLVARSVEGWSHGKNGATVAPIGTVREPTEWVLLLGVSPLAEFYIHAVSGARQTRLRIAGLMAEGAGTKGRVIAGQRVLGSPHDLSAILRELDIHGIDVRRIVLSVPFDTLTPQARLELVRAERERAIQVQSIEDMLGISIGSGEPVAVASQDSAHPDLSPRRPSIDGPRPLYLTLKRLADVVGALLLMIALLPLIALVAVGVAADVGWPILFWQQRPGRNGEPFKLYKFRTMRSAHSEDGNRVPDGNRVTGFGALLRRLRLDELPQVYNVLCGDMSFVGPRPLLWSDMPRDPRLRLSVRPGVTGWAQVNGGRAVTAEDKDALDSWYVTNVSPALDLKILRRTIRLIYRGDRINPKALRAAGRNLAPNARTEATVTPYTSLTFAVHDGLAQQNQRPQPPPLDNSDELKKARWG